MATLLILLVSDETADLCVENNTITSGAVLGPPRDVEVRV